VNIVIKICGCRRQLSYKTKVYS